MPDPIRLAVDVAGGDYGAAVSVPAAIDALDQDALLSVSLFGDESAIRPYLAGLPAVSRDRITLTHTAIAVPMDQRPARALRHGRGSSLWLALEAVANGDADACVSAGNTGALMVLARRLIGTLNGIDRPALMSWLPSETGHTYLLDLGANIGVRAEHLVQFAVMGTVFAAQVDGIDRPAVGLVNVGREDSKGDNILQSAARVLSESPLNYIGFVEGNDIYQGGVNVVVCDGMIGNIVLKSSEGLARMLFSALNTHLQRGWRARLTGWVGASVLRRWVAQFDPGAHNGAALLGLRGVVVKSHGGADRAATTNALSRAALEARRNVPENIETLVKTITEKVET